MQRAFVAMQVVKGVTPTTFSARVPGTNISVSKQKAPSNKMEKKKTGNDGRTLTLNWSFPAPSHRIGRQAPS